MDQAQWLVCADKVMVNGKQLAQYPTASNLFVNSHASPHPHFSPMDFRYFYKTQLKK